MSIEQAVAYGLAENEASRPVCRHARHATGGQVRVHLSARERDVLSLIAHGCTTKEIAAALTLSPRTVERHTANLYRKIDARNRTQATAYALRHGIIPQNHVSLP